MRSSGILLPVSSLPGKYGIGCFSKEAYGFIDFLEKAGQSLWQILPLGQTSYGDSPYQSFSTFAGNPYFISLEELVKEGLLSERECNSLDFGKKTSSIDYGKLYQGRYKLLKLAYERADIENKLDFTNFCEIEKNWLDDYALFMALKDSHSGKSWSEWEDDIRTRQPKAMEFARKKLRTEICFYQYLQYLFFTQWKKLKHYANEKGIKIIGDLPIYVAFDSADAWSNPKMFQFDDNCKPLAVAGCPPDGFAPTGQLWGNPLYKWEYHKQTDYSWWIQRMDACNEMYDMVRIDHFRGFDEYYSIPAGDDTAEHGHWEKGPGYELFQKIEEKLGKLNIIVEDLGFITDSVRKLVKETGWPNMKVLEFAFDARDQSGPSEYLPYRYNENCVVYTGTHDNETLLGWLDNICLEDYSMVEEYLDRKDARKEELVVAMIRLAMGSVANWCIIPMQDYLCLGNEARMNQPSTLGENWKWRVTQTQLSGQLAERICKISRIYGRVCSVKKASEEKTKKKQ